MDAMQSTFDELYAYTMGREGFVLQHVVDAYGAQTANDATRPIRLVFALVGLYLRVERGFSGHEVQRVHMLMGRRKHAWPAIPLPGDRGRMTAADVLAVRPGSPRDHAIDDWCRSVWEAFRASRPRIVVLLHEHDIT
jgi:hypothetical protein